MICKQATVAHNAHTLRNRRTKEINAQTQSISYAK